MVWGIMFSCEHDISGMPWGNFFKMTLIPTWTCQWTDYVLLIKVFYTLIDIRLVFSFRWLLLHHVIRLKVKTYMSVNCNLTVVLGIKQWGCSSSLIHTKNVQVYKYTFDAVKQVNVIQNLTSRKMYLRENRHFCRLVWKQHLWITPWSFVHIKVIW